MGRLVAESRPSRTRGLKQVIKQSLDFRGGRVPRGRVD